MVVVWSRQPPAPPPPPLRHCTHHVNNNHHDHQRFIGYLLFGRGATAPAENMQKTITTMDITEGRPPHLRRLVHEPRHPRLLCLRMCPFSRSERARLSQPFKCDRAVRQECATQLPNGHKSSLFSMPPRRVDQKQKISTAATLKNSSLFVKRIPRLVLPRSSLRTTTMAVGLARTIEVHDLAGRTCSLRFGSNSVEFLRNTTGHFVGPHRK